MLDISVIIPTYNREKLIERSIESVLKQKGQGTKYKILEIIIIDDASDDNTEETVKAINDDRIVYHRLALNGGAAVARNTGVTLANGDWIAFQDSDDQWREYKLIKQTEYIEGHPDVYMVSHPVRSYFADGSEHCTGMVVGDDPVVCLAERNYYGTPAMLIKKDSFLELGGFNTELRALEDWEFALRFADRYKIGMLPEALIDVDMTIEGISADPAKYYESRCRMIAADREILLRHGCFEGAMKSLFLHAQNNGILDEVGKMMELYLKQIQ